MADYSTEGKLQLYPYDTRFRPIAPPTTGIFDEPLMSICFNVKWAAHIDGVLERLMWRDAWKGDKATQLWAIDQIQRLMSLMLLRNPCGETMTNFKLRQNPANPCQLQQSTNNGASWALAFDYSLCQQRNLGNEYLIEQNIQNIYQTWNNTTTNTEINQYAPEQTFRSSTGDSEELLDARDKALCSALQIYVAAFCETILELNSLGFFAANLVAAGLGVAGAVIGAIGVIGAAPSGGTSLPVFLGLSAAVIGLGSSLFQGLTEAILKDTDARQELACCMYKNLRDQVPNQASFIASADGCDDLSANAEMMRSHLAETLNGIDATDQFHAFINLLGEQTRYGELGLLPDCPCDECILEEIVYPIVAGGDERLLISSDSGLALGGRYLTSPHTITAVFDEPERRILSVVLTVRRFYPFGDDNTATAGAEVAGFYASGGNNGGAPYTVTAVFDEPVMASGVVLQFNGDIIIDDLRVNVCEE